MTRGLLASPFGLLIGLSLGALGSGGSILAVPALVYAAGQSVQDATFTSLVLVGTSALTGIHPHWRAGRVRLATGVVFGLTGIGGSLAGTALNRRLDPHLLLLAFSGLIVVAAWRMLTGCPTCTRVGEARELAVRPAVGARPALDARRALEVLGAGSVVGFLTGLFGVGGGFIIVPALTLVLGLAMPEAIGTSLVVIAINSGLGVLARLGGHVDWHVAVPFTIAAVLGVQLGGALAARLNPTRSLQAFAAGLVAVALYTATQAIRALG
ncbi:MAG: sulfite exporter TauE/SafE family protein [Deltaproteobacteria bacterium]|nr:sulfite exporter TauE/SafE family protein [Deltaproteobacteria bacterium]